MAIYTKTGDLGETSLVGGSRIRKDHPRVSAYGCLDELNASLGVVLAEESLPVQMRPALDRVQSDLFCIEAELATPFVPTRETPGLQQLRDDRLLELEREIDEVEKRLPRQTDFLVPGGGRPAALLFQACTVCRRAEREILVLHQQEPVRQLVLAFVNRLSDYLFVLARAANHAAGIKERTPG